MHRFPNPSSTIENFIAVFLATYERCRGPVFVLDDVVRAAVEANLATSSGHAGETAISRSTRKDRSRDPLYNQMKMYTELFRSLGWIRSTEDSALSFSITLLGHQLVEANRDWKPLLCESVLGIAYPSHVLNVQHDHKIRPFGTILRTMRLCDDGLTRDEMIVGPLSAQLDRTIADIDSIMERVVTVRGNQIDLTNALDDLSLEAGIQINTMKNYTRWPLSIMKSLGWTSKESELRGNTRVDVHRLTPLGQVLADRIVNSFDVRADQVDELPFAQRKALARHVHLSMLERTGFDITSAVHGIGADRDSLDLALTSLGVPKDQHLLYSPFQSLTIEDSLAIFPSEESTRVIEVKQRAKDGPVVGRGTRDHLFVAPVFVPQIGQVTQNHADELRSELQYYCDNTLTLEDASRQFTQSRENDSQAEFYPLVVQLFRLLGFHGSTSRVGDNYSRWDAWVILSASKVPIEIKSPSEELYLSTKAIRQAIENKVILLARYGSSTSHELTSLIVGYQLPNERGDLSSLIEDIHTTYGFNVGVLDLRTLVALAIRSIAESVSIDEKQLSYLRGFLSV